ncbi:phage virion morphogenesis protein [Pseudomonas sp. M30-35]|uniref:phage virion morphogenesis protein n=1 Tax=Pseudomonas sp. M30-35 TaxID=1981174 RepID=UPI000B3C4955|nr:phage virion morphogenesis protein [Pseudomonas sp. M30-35]ARU87112.1 phage virion morphogenesis protein [Pseudomonas sp. M30-35]
MAGATLEFDATGALAIINEAAAAVADPKPMLRNIGEYLLIAHDRRFASQSSPDGTPWQALSPAYLKRKKKNRDKILTLDGFLKNTLRYQVGDNDLVFGTNRIYGAIQHFGGSIDIAARSQQAYFRQDRKTGDVGNLFVSKRKSNFSQWVTLGAYTIQIPSRPWLGTSEDDNYAIAGIAMRYLMPNSAES